MKTYITGLIFIISLFTVSGIIFNACRHEPFFIGEIDTICFESQVLPILLNSCGTTGCHGAGSSENEFILTDYESVLQIVTPGDARSSTLYQLITAENGEDMMPPDQPLTKEARTIIHLWIAQGAKNTTCEGGTDVPPGNEENPPSIDTVTFVQDILPVLISTCATSGCHDAATHEEDYNFSTYASLMSSGTVKPFNPNDSKLYKVITENDDDRMPPAGNQQLTAEQIKNIRTWIAQGALNSDYIDASCDTTGTIEFSTQVWPVIQTNCTGCHNSTVAGGGINLNSYQNVKTSAETIKLNVPLILGAIRKMNGFAPMPQGSSLSECDVRKIELWIDQGRLNN